MTLDRIKFIAIAIVVMPMMAFTFFGTNGVQAVRVAVDDDTAAVYKAKCAMCHSPKAEKHFNLETSDEEHVKAVLEGKKGEKPPFMPGFAAKGMTEDQAKALVAHMRALRTPPAE